MTDPVAKKSTFLRMYMSNHPDTLIAYAKWFGKVEEVVKSAEMSYIDCKNVSIACTLNDGVQKSVTIPFKPPLTGYDDVKPRLLEMKALAQEGLGMIKTPRISSLSLPRDALSTLLFTFFFVYLYFTPAQLPATAPSLANTIQSFLGPYLISFTFWTLFTAHILESLYTLYLCHNHSTGILLGAAYVAATLLSGFPIWKHLLKKIQQARIDSVMKVQ